MPDIDTDSHFLRHALALARQGIGLASPNPCVGAVLVSNEGDIVGEGFYTYEGTRHAEIIAIERAGGRARDATLYINLEPCSHHGRTGPCADAVIAAKIWRVVACMSDPNPLVSGNGFDRLRAAGITVESGMLIDEAKALNENFARYIRRHIPLVTLKGAMTLDGKIAAPPRTATKSVSAATWITGEAARSHVQQLRHRNDAIMVGVGTVIADDPLLTDRSGNPRRRPLSRVILDSRLRLPLDSRIVQTAQNDVIVLCSLAEEKKKKQLLRCGVRVEQIPVGSTDGRPDMEAIVKFLGQMEITGVLVEGGAHVNWAVLAAGVADKVFLYYAPTILAGSESIPFVEGSGFRTLRDAPRLKSIKFHHFEEDFAVEGYLRDPYKD